MSENRALLEPREAVAKVEIDYNQAVFRAYLNCIDSFRDLETESQGSGFFTSSFSHVARDKFPANVQVLESMVLEEWKDERYRKERTNMKTYMELFHGITQLLHRRGFFEHQVSLLE